MNELKQIQSEIKKGIFKSVYVFDGEEPYFMDVLIDDFEQNVLQPHERDFNLNILYGKDSTWTDVVNACRSYPAFAERRLVILKEAAQLKNFSKLESYIAQPSPNTVLVIAYKHSKIDGRASIAKTIKKTGVYITFDKVPDYKITQWILDYCQSHQLKINDTNANLLGLYLGTDLQKIVNELGKLLINLQPNEEIKATHIEKYIGISKEYNVYEFAKAILQKQFEQAFKIVNYFIQNPKDNSLIQIVSTCYNEFAKLYVYHYCRTLSDDDIASTMKLRNKFFLKEYKLAANHYSLKQTVQAILLLQDFNLNSLGVGTLSNNHTLLKEYTSKILSL